MWCWVGNTETGVCTQTGLRVYHLSLMYDPVLVYPETPTLVELLRLRIPERIGSNYMTFGLLLLQDSVGAVMHSIKHQYNGSIHDIIMTTLQRWLQGGGLEPVTWSSLIGVLRDCGLEVLAAEIEQAIKGIYYYYTI